MKTSKTLFALLAAALLGAATLFSSPAPSAAWAFERVQGQDKAGKNCERIDTPGSSTFGKCENVCKDKEITRDAPNNRWVCKASKVVVNRTPITRVPGVKLQEQNANPNPQRQTPDAAKVGKAKK